jgi:hypothetical protein
VSCDNQPLPDEACETARKYHRHDATFAGCITANATAPVGPPELMNPSFS